MSIKMSGNYLIALALKIKNASEASCRAIVYTQMPVSFTKEKANDYGSTLKPYCDPCKTSVFL